MQVKGIKGLQEIKQEYERRVNEIVEQHRAGQLHGEALDQALNQAHEDYCKALHEKVMYEKKVCSLKYRRELEWGQIHTRKDWEKLLAESRHDYMTGRFFLERIGHERNTDPHLVATLLELRRSWITEYQIETVPEFLLVDMALASYYHFLRLNMSMGNLEMLIERELFEQDHPTVKRDVTQPYCPPTGLQVEDYIARWRQELLPQLDRLSKMFLRSLKALRDLKRANVELHIAQVNIGQRQVNLVATRNEGQRPLRQKR